MEKNIISIPTQGEKEQCVAYGRVSSAEQRDGFSLDAQSRLFDQTAERENVNIFKKYIVDESASGKKERAIFAEMFRFMRENDIHLLYGEKVDRLSRNPREVLMIQDWIDEDPRNKVYAIKENLLIHKYAKAHEIFIWDVKVAAARFYINNLSEESRKGIDEKARQGYYHGAYKAGYKSVGEKGRKIMVPDDTTFTLWKKLGEKYMEGDYTMKKLVKDAWDIGLRSRYGKKIYKSQIESFLKDPFYCGTIVKSGQVITTLGKHEAMWTQEQFDLIQEIRVRRKSPFYSKHIFLFSKLIECGECKGMITSEVQKGHVYCHCTHYKGCSQKKYTRQETIEQSLLGVMEVFETITDEEAQEIVTRIKQSHQEEIKYKTEVLNNLEGSYRGLQNKIDRLYDDRLSGIITDLFWKDKNAQLQSEQKGIIDQITKLKTQEAKYFELGINILELARRAKSIYENDERTDEERRMLLKSIFSEITLKNGEITYTLHEPVRNLYERLVSVKNIFEPKKAFANTAKALSEAKIATMLPR